MWVLGARISNGMGVLKLSMGWGCGCWVHGEVMMWVCSSYRWGGDVGVGVGVNKACSCYRPAGRKLLVAYVETRTNNGYSI